MITNNKDPLASDESAVLVVEDYQDTRLLLKMYVEMSGYRVLEAADGEEAVAVAKRVCGSLRLILMDLSLPAQDGIATITLIREITQLCHVPIVACTAHSELEYRNVALAAGCCDFIAKPVDFNKLGRVLERWAPKMPDAPGV